MGTAAEKLKSRVVSPGRWADVCIYATEHPTACPEYLKDAIAFALQMQDARDAMLEILCRASVVLDRESEEYPLTGSLRSLQDEIDGLLEAID